MLYMLLYVVLDVNKKKNRTICDVLWEALDVLTHFITKQIYVKD